jgi:hypothetical protein
MAINDISQQGTLQTMQGTVHCYCSGVKGVRIVYVVRVSGGGGEDTRNACSILLRLFLEKWRIVRQSALGDNIKMHICVNGSRG